MSQPTVVDEPACKRKLTKGQHCMAQALEGERWQLQQQRATQRRRAQWQLFAEGAAPSEEDLRFLIFVNRVGIVGRDAVQALNSLVARFHGHFFNKRCAGGDVFAVPEAKREAALVGLREAGYVAADAKSWARFRLLTRAEREARTVSVPGVTWDAISDLINLLLKGQNAKWLLTVSAWGLADKPDKAVFQAVFGSIGAAKQVVAECQANRFWNAKVACLTVRTVCLELTQPVSAQWLAAELGPGAWFRLENHPLVVSLRWRILTVHPATVEWILDIIGDHMAAVALRDLPPEFIPSSTRRPRPRQAWKQETGASVVRGAPTQSTTVPASRARSLPMQQPSVQTLPPGGLVPLQTEVNQLQAELAVIPSL